MANKIIKITGRLFNKKNQPLSGLRIEAWDKDLLVDDFLAFVGVFTNKLLNKTL